MIQVEFKSVGEGTCGWCKRAKDEVYDVVFSDHSFIGPMCKADLLRAISMKLDAAQPAKKAATPVAALANATTTK